MQSDVPYSNLDDADVADGNEEVVNRGCRHSLLKIIVPSLAQLSAAYNFGIIDFILQSEACSSSQPSWVSSATSSSVFVGAVAGQVILGIAGDVLGRRKSMMITLSLIIFGALACGLLTWGPHKLVLLTIFRFVLGIGNQPETL